MAAFIILIGILFSVALIFFAIGLVEVLMKMTPEQFKTAMKRRKPLVLRRLPKKK